LEFGITRNLHNRPITAYHRPKVGYGTNVDYVRYTVPETVITITAVHANIIYIY